MGHLNLNVLINLNEIMPILEPNGASRSIDIGKLYIASAKCCFMVIIWIYFN